MTVARMLADETADLIDFVRQRGAGPRVTWTGDDLDDFVGRESRVIGLHARCAATEGAIPMEIYELTDNQTRTGICYQSVTLPDDPEEAYYEIKMPDEWYTRMCGLQSSAAVIDETQSVQQQKKRSGKNDPLYDQLDELTADGKMSQIKAALKLTNDNHQKAETLLRGYRVAQPEAIRKQPEAIRKRPEAKGT